MKVPYVRTSLVWQLWVPARERLGSTESQEYILARRNTERVNRKNQGHTESVP